jgi:hypothetical protein
MKPPFPRPRSIFHVRLFVLVAAFGLLARPALSSPPPNPLTLRGSSAAKRPIAWVPDQDRLVDVANEVASFSPELFAKRAARGQATARACTLQDDNYSCRCVTMDTDIATYRAKSWQRRGDTVVARKLSVHLKEAANPERVFVESWRFDGQHSLEETVLARPLGQLRTLAAQRIRLIASEKTASGQVKINNLRWHRASPTLGEASCGGQWPDGLGEPSMTATSAGLDEGRWRFVGLKLEGTHVRVSDFDALSPGPVSGFLPPSLIYSDEIVSLQASYLLAQWGVAPQAVVAPTSWYGLGFGLMSHVERDGGGPPAIADETSLLDAQLRWSDLGTHDEATGSQATGRVQPAVLGDGFWGAPYTHLAAGMEEVGERRFWTIDRFRRDAPFRPWRLSRAGVSLSGPTHVLNLQVLHTERLGHWDALGPQPDTGQDILGANLLLGTHHELDEQSSADLEVEHQSLVDGDAAAHATTLRVGVEGVVGSSGALYVRPALYTWLQTGLESEPDDPARIGSGPVGTEASTRSQIVAMVDAGAALRARFGATTHRIEPGIVLAREVVGFSRGALVGDGGRRGPSRVFDDREEGFSLGALRLDQQLSLGPNLSIDLPVALVFEGAGLVEAVETKPWAIGALNFRAPRSEFGVHAACPGLCEDIFWTASAAATLGAFDLVYIGGDLRREVLLPLSWRRSVHDGWALIQGFQHQHAQHQHAQHEHAQPADLADRSAHFAELGWRHGRFGTKVAAYYRSKHNNLGLSVGNTYAFPELGWTVGVHAAVGPDDRDWGVLVGLSPTG